MSNGRGCAGLMEEWQELGPSPFCEFDGGDSSNDACSGVSNEITEEMGQKINATIWTLCSLGFCDNKFR